MSLIKFILRQFFKALEKDRFLAVEVSFFYPYPSSIPLRQKPNSSNPVLDRVDDIEIDIEIDLLTGILP